MLSWVILEYKFMEKVLLLIMTLGYFFLQLFWFFMDSRSVKEKVRFYILLKGNVCSRIISFGLALFILIKFISPSWMFSVHFNSVALNTFLSVGGVSLYSIGMILCVWARLAMYDAWTPAEEKSIKHKRDLITHGPFSFIRNPIYLGLLMIYLGFFIAMRSYLIVMVLFIVWFFYKKALEEEKTLEKNFGSDYIKYKSKVRRFI